MKEIGSLIGAIAGASGYWLFRSKFGQLASFGLTLASITVAVGVLVLCIWIKMKLESRE